MHQLAPVSPTLNSIIGLSSRSSISDKQQFNISYQSMNCHLLELKMTSLIATWLSVASYTAVSPNDTIPYKAYGCRGFSVKHGKIAISSSSTCTCTSHVSQFRDRWILFTRASAEYIYIYIRTLGKSFQGFGGTGKQGHLVQGNKGTKV